MTHCQDQAGQKTQGGGSFGGIGAFLAEFSALLARDRREGGFFGGIHGSFGQRGHANAC